MDIELKKCPECGGQITLMFGLTRKCQCFARCSACSKEYELPTVKAKILKNLRISKTTVSDARTAWNKQLMIFGGKIIMAQNVCFKYKLGQKIYWVRDNKYKDEYLVKLQINTNFVNNPIRYAIEKYGRPQCHEGYRCINEVPEKELFESYQDAIDSLN